MDLWLNRVAPCIKQTGNHQYQYACDLDDRYRDIQVAAFFNAEAVQPGQQ
jgi:hypothetical protein